MAFVPAAQVAVAAYGMKTEADAERRRQEGTIIRGPPPKESVSMAMYLIIGVVITVILIAIMMLFSQRDVKSYSSWGFKNK
jgi:high-affinity nickel permease